MSDDNITDIDEHRPHFVLPSLDTRRPRIHVFPVEMARRIASGSLASSEVEDGDDIVRTIISEWLEWQGL